MSQIEDGPAAWFQAITLAERGANLRTWEGKLEYDEELAAKHLERWRAGSSLSEDRLFAQRLALDNLTRAEFEALLVEPSQSLQARYGAPPTWLTGLYTALAQPGQMDEAVWPFPGQLDQRMAGFLELVRPLIFQARQQLSQGIAQFSGDPGILPFDPATIEGLLLEGLDVHLFELVAPTLALELQVARFSGLLAGETPQARFDSFIELLRQADQRTSLLREYSVLARLVQTVLQNRVNFGLEFLRHLTQDWLSLCQTFSPTQHPGKLVKIETGRGDTHRGGRSVMILTFSSGLKLVYKPRSLAVDLHFQELLGWLNDNGAKPSFRTLKVLTREAHGWVEFVEVAGCNSAEELTRFYRRQGGYLAVLYILGGTDFHYENLVAAGEHPVLIDLETLFHPGIAPGNPAEVSNSESENTTYSVLNVGLLPCRAWANEGFEGVELSGLGGQEGQLSPYPMPGWEGSGTDRLRRVYKRILVPPALNRPHLNGSSVRPLDYLAEIVEGFSAIYRLLSDRKAEFLAPGHLLRNFSQDLVRVVLRPTHAYQLLQEHRLRPDYLRNALDLDRHYDKLWVSVKHFHALARLIASECHDLHQDDYPFYTTRPDSTHLWTSTGNQISNFVTEPGLVLVERRLDRMNERDLANQIRFIRASLSSDGT
ncbi:MAG: type 2 lantipeptide synthetase LanM [Chloroflexi bacterium]|nr:type 2 lantipeptide synthetase LanM [Chloroflexota bacterium]OJV92728.1 MAG: hypothetical protein BGO39_29585 [Chloroflexi bacterium 54-19]